MNNGYNFKKWGTGRRSLIFLHNFGGSGLCWQWIARQMPSEYTCYAPDIPGFGSSRALDNPSVARLATEMLVLFQEMDWRSPSPTVIAHGFSATLVLKMLSLKAHTWENLIFINPSLPAGADYNPAETRRMAEHPCRQVAMETVRRSTTMPLKADRFSLAVESQLMADPGTWQWWLNEGCRETIDPSPKIECPLTVLSSTRDPRVDLIATRRQIARRYPMALVREHPTAGHLLPLEDDIWVAAQLRTALPSRARSRRYVIRDSLQK